MPSMVVMHEKPKRKLVATVNAEKCTYARRKPNYRVAYPAIKKKP